MTDGGYRELTDGQSLLAWPIESYFPLLLNNTTQLRLTSLLPLDGELFGVCRGRVGRTGHPHEVRQVSRQVGGVRRIISIGRQSEALAKRHQVRPPYVRKWIVFFFRLATSVLGGRGLRKDPRTASGRERLSTY